MSWKSASQRYAWIPVVLVLPWLLLWPAPLVFTTHVLSAPDQEAVSHLWGLWAALDALDPVVVHTDRIHWPLGFSFVLIEPGNLPWFALGSVLGPVAGFNMVLLGGVMVVGVAGALLTRAAGGDGAHQSLGAVVAMATPALVAGAGEGISESFAVGWVGVALGALLLHLKQDRGWRWGVLAALALALGVWGGPYNALWGAVLCGAVGLWRLRDWRRTLPIAAAALILSSPAALPLLLMRREGLPGTATRMEWDPPLPDAEGFRGGFKLGADLVDPFLPDLLIGGVPEVSHTAYLGLAALIMAVVAVVRQRRRWPWLAGALALALLSLGPWLVVWGHPLSLGDGSVSAPAGALGWLLPPLQRLTRWYRAAAVAGMLLAPLVAMALEGRWRWLAGGLVLADALLLSPGAWPVHHFDARPSGVWAQLDRPGAVVDLPPDQYWFVPEGGVRERNLLEQTWHGRPSAATFFNLSGGAAGSPPVRDLLALAKGRKRALVHDPQHLADLGYAWVVLDLTRIPDARTDRLEEALGPPVAQDERYLVYELPVQQGQAVPDFPPIMDLSPKPGRPGQPGGVQEGPGGHRRQLP